MLPPPNTVILDSSTQQLCNKDKKNDGKLI